MPHVRFVGPDLREHTLVSRMGASPARWPVGTSVPVAFLEARPVAGGDRHLLGRLWVAPAALYAFAAALAYAAYTAA